MRSSTHGKKLLLIRARGVCGEMRQGRVMCTEKQVNGQKICCELMEILFLFSLKFS